MRALFRPVFCDQIIAVTSNEGFHITMQHLEPDKVGIMVADDGPGFDSTLLNDRRTGSQTFGLLNIRDRVRSFGGKLQINSGPIRGTRITLWLPRGSAAPVRSVGPGDYGLGGYPTREPLSQRAC
jgi:signal transduction histidine kinase